MDQGEPRLYWSEEQAREAHRRFVDAGGDGTSKAAPLNRWWTLRTLEIALQWQHCAGDPMALFTAIFICATHKLPLPDWAVAAFVSGYQKVSGYDAASWDEVFGRPHPKGRKLWATKQESKKMFLVWKRVEELRQQDGRIGEKAWRTVCDEFGIELTLCKRIHRKGAALVASFRREL